ncbi:roundabout homolog 2-like [Anguilla anguilla]|uniref:roundabout homolog 2-like n=1 Tax=Anguilla anguilla TaxID=7936 RepID=UPI0015B1A5D4|nr:roundabout homolog 2-like [Anguilla anguilla]XP_035272351.1 roundabout homolog 2-like [Anguilla anguilla]XP_035272352.1 roundabout homolog 2-like [Anguilla anguilla]XP_035272353.1 roundabout homolog 2-like [Anguilla anguilla]
MALKSIVLVSLFLLVLSVSHAVPLRSTFERTFGASVTLPCDGSAFRGTPEAQLDVLWRTSDGRKVAHYSGGTHRVGVPFEGRVTFPTERIRAGDFALTLGALAFGDKDSYQCVWSEGQGGEKLLSNVTLVILAPPFSNSTSVSAGDPVALPCYGRVTGRAPDDKLFVRWQKDGALILQLSNGEFTYGSTFTERASVSLDAVRRGNFSLSLSVTGPADEGTYECSAERSQTGTSLSLKVKDHQTSVIVEHGTTFNICVPRVPAKVLFLKEDTDVLVCKALVDYAKCEGDYNGRVRYEEGTLQLRDVKPSDEGRYTVRAIYDDIIVKEVRLEVTTALPQGLYGFTLMVSVCLLALVMRKLKCGPKQMLGVFTHCVNQMK